LVNSIAGEFSVYPPIRMELDLSVLGRSFIVTRRNSSITRPCIQSSNFSVRVLQRNKHRPLCFSTNPSNSSFIRFQKGCDFSHRCQFVVLSATGDHVGISQKHSDSTEKVDSIRILLKRGIVLGAVVCGVLFYGCGKVLASTSVVDVAFSKSILLLKNAWPKTSQVLKVLREQGLILAVLLGLSAFFSMAETSITTLWPWKVINNSSPGFSNANDDKLFCFYSYLHALVSWMVL